MMRDMRSKYEIEVCAFVRKIMTAAMGERIESVAHPGWARLSESSVEQLWDSPSHRFAVAHAMLESSFGTPDDDSKFFQLIAPLEQLLAGWLPGTFEVEVAASAASSVKVPHVDACVDIASQVLVAAQNMATGDRVTLQRPLPVYLHRRSAAGSRAIVSRAAELAQPRVILNMIPAVAKFPKLAAACQDGRLGVLAMETNDIDMPITEGIAATFRHCFSLELDPPDIVIHVRTERQPFRAWVITNRSNIQLDTHYEDPSE
jgi:hypothetical protein